MNNNRVLILGVAPVQTEAIKELNKMGYETFACAKAHDGPGAKEADHFKEIDILDSEELISYIKDNNISLVYSVGSDLAMPVASYISEKLNLPHFVTERSARICNNKNLLRKELGDDFEGNIKFQILSNRDEKVKLNYPYIMKPTDSQGQRGIFLINNGKEHIDNFDKAQEYSRSGLVIIEDYISGPELSVNGYVVNGKIEYFVVSGRETWPNYTGLIHKHVVRSYSQDIEAKIATILNNACDKLNIKNGPVYAQMKLEENNPYVIEITPRLDGCHMWKVLSLYNGVNLLKLTFNHLIKNDISDLGKLKENNNKKYTLEFICQAPHTRADYTKYQRKISQAINSCCYYRTGEKIRPVNGKYEKIGYFIYESN